MALSPSKQTFTKEMYLHYATSSLSDLNAAIAELNQNAEGSNPSLPYLEVTRDLLQKFLQELRRIPHPFTTEEPPESCLEKHSLLAHPRSCKNPIRAEKRTVIKEAYPMPKRVVNLKPQPLSINVPTPHPVFAFDTLTLNHHLSDLAGIKNRLKYIQVPVKRPPLEKKSPLANQVDNTPIAANQKTFLQNYVLMALGVAIIAYEVFPIITYFFSFL